MSISKIRSGFIQANFNEGLGKLLANELAVISIVTGIVLAFLWNWQWLFIGIVLTPIVLGIGLFIPYVRDIILIALGFLWALPFIAIGIFIPFFYVFAVLAFFFSFWVHYKGLSFYSDIDRS